MRLRDIPAAVALMDREVDWANGQDGGHVHGREAVRAYWTQQWAAIQPKVDPLEITPRDAGVTAVEVHQVVQDLDGKLLLDERVRHVFRIRDGLVVRFDIENAGGLSTLAHGRGRRVGPGRPDAATHLGVVKLIHPAK